MEVDEANAVVDAVALAEEVIVLVVDDPIDVTVDEAVCDMIRLTVDELAVVNNVVEVEEVAWNDELLTLPRDDEFTVDA